MQMSDNNQTKIVATALRQFHLTCFELHLEVEFLSALMREISSRSLHEPFANPLIEYLAFFQRKDNRIYPFA